MIKVIKNNIRRNHQEKLLINRLKEEVCINHRLERALTISDHM